jgi:hypothetical protein
MFVSVLVRLGLNTLPHPGNPDEALGTTIGITTPSDTTDAIGTTTATLLPPPAHALILAPRLSTRYRHQRHVMHTRTAPTFRHPAAPIDARTTGTIGSLPTSPLLHGIQRAPVCLYPAMVRHPTDAPHRLCPNGLDKYVVSVLHTSGYTPCRPHGFSYAAPSP